MELRDTTKRYFIDGPYNCAESTLLIARDELGLPVTDAIVHALGAFGGGMGCGETCGAIAGGCAAIGCTLIEVAAHKSPAARLAAAAFTRRFLDKYGTLRCEQLKERCFKPDIRCGELVEEAVGCLKEALKENS